MRHKLTATTIRAAADGKLQDGGGLVLVKAGDRGKWVFRYSFLGRRREMGLGPWPAVTLAAARKARDAAHAEILAGRDPLEVRAQERRDLVAQRERSDPTLEAAVRQVFEARQATLRGGGSRGRWLSPLELHVLPKLGRYRISEIDRERIRATLAPIWRDKHATAIKAWRRLRIVFREMQLAGAPCDPFTVDAAKRMLGEVIHTSTPTPATAWQDMPQLFARLDRSPGGDCLRFCMLTLVRLGGVRPARQSEIEGGIWTVPADRVKGPEGRVQDFRVPLSAPAIEIAQRAAAYHPELLFPGARNGSPVTDRALERQLDRLGEPGRPHGFRSAFRSWVQDTDACTWEVAETILGHAIGNRVERAYARSDLLERRRVALDAWAAFLTGAQAGATVRRIG